MFTVNRSKHNPVLIPSPEHYWTAFAAFNPSVIKRGRTIYALYRAMSLPDVLTTPNQRSIIGVAESSDGGEHFIKHAPFIAPEAPWEQFGCEDPRVTYFEGKYYTFYTALSEYPFSADGIKVAVAVSKNLKQVDERHLVTPFNAKAMTLFPERIGGKVTVIFSAHTDMPPARMEIIQVDNIDELWDKKTWSDFEENIQKYYIDPRRTPYDHVEVGTPPIKTPHGWLIFYSHIQNYFPGQDNAQRLFGIEALLLDHKDPTKIIGRTKGPLLSPEESYERAGHVNDVVFPTGALLEKDTIHLYYGATDTTVCMASVNMTDLTSSMCPNIAPEWHFKRFSGNPIIAAHAGHPWEKKATFNPGAIRLAGKTHLFYRAVSSDNTSSIGHATTKDGLNIDSRSLEPIYVPRAPFEMKKIEGSNSGCEDPRVTKIGNRIYMCYTAFDGIGPARVAVSSILEKDFLNNVFKWSEPELITPAAVDDKDTCLLPEKFGKKYFLLHRVGTDICGDYIDSLDFKKSKITKCIRILGPRQGSWDGIKVGITAPPMKTKKGWLLLYHAVSRVHHTYRVGAALLDLKDPTIVRARSADPIFEPEALYEKVGIVNNVVFPCGMVSCNGLLYIYYGGADQVTGVATMKLDILLKALSR